MIKKLSPYYAGNFFCMGFFYMNPPIRPLYPLARLFPCCYDQKTKMALPIVNFVQITIIICWFIARVQAWEIIWHSRTETSWELTIHTEKIELTLGREVDDSIIEELFQLSIGAEMEQLFVVNLFDLIYCFYEAGVGPAIPFLS